MASIPMITSIGPIGQVIPATESGPENGPVSKDWFLVERNGVNFLLNGEVYAASNTQPSLMGIGREHQNFWGNI